MKGTLLGKGTTLLPHLDFHRSVFPETLYFPQVMSPLLTMWFGFQSVSNEWHNRIAASIGGTFLKTHT
jgi:hypothetical protein